MPFQQVTTPTFPLFVSWLMEETLEQEIPARQGRTNPRVVKKRTARAEVSSALGRSKKPRSKFFSQKPIYKAIYSQPKQLTFSIFNSA